MQVAEDELKKKLKKKESTCSSLRWLRGKHQHVANVVLRHFMKYYVFVSYREDEGKIIAFFCFSENLCRIHMRRNKRLLYIFIATLLQEKELYCLKKSAICLLKSGNFSLKFYFIICLFAVMYILVISQWSSKRRK